MEETVPVEPVCITSVSVEGLHGQFDVELPLRPGLNVIYGKNGRGKTTMLHLLANLLELDFMRFRYLQFRKVHVTTSSGDVVEINKNEDVNGIRILVNGASTSYGEAGLSSLELTSLRQVLGGRATYLPAFRSVLERTKSDMPSSYYRMAGAKATHNFESIQKQEFDALREVADSFGIRQLQEEAAAAAEKTNLCRQWFGSFVPIIRYPSISDVEDALSEEWRRAQLEVTAREQRMFEETFVRVFRVSAGLDDRTTDVTNEGILQEISDLLEAQEKHSGGADSREINQALLSSARQLSTMSLPSGGMNTSLLEVYREALFERDRVRQDAFKKTREFELSVNKFLDRKSVSIGRLAGATRRPRTAVSVVTEGGNSYGLSALSSGERQIVTMLYSASRTKFRSGMFLIDEPELSLHIDWQRIILRELQRQAPDRQIIVCTHSPEVGADHFYNLQDFEPKPTQERQGALFADEDEEGV
ncbi:AAA family ATPase [Xanthomonas campestris pv. plantaginis]|uniref:AAA family ATPase n=1 Tax=Xanthomonas campestris TaxID=339 RepID=UPI002B22DFD9|nr:AAA family ATPase [Xanthomonas campestris]MEA9607524.1 AAA family ATPase [Xanthomonas campestris pv. plantaginis]